MDEKRKAARIEKNLIVMYTSESTEEDYRTGWDSAFIKNISETGMFFNTKKQFLANEKIRLMFKVPLDPFNWLETQGAVIESCAYAYGSFMTRVKFLNLNDAQTKLVRDYIVWFLRKEEKLK